MIDRNSFVAPATKGTARTLEGSDIEFVDPLADGALAGRRVDPRRVTLSGFSPGAGMAIRVVPAITRAAVASMLGG